MRMLLVSTAWPWPTRKGYQLRLLQLAEALADRHQVTLLVPAPAGTATGAALPPRFAVETFRHSRLDAVRGVGSALFAPRALESGLVESNELRRRLRELAPQSDRVVLQLVRLAGVADLLAGTPWILDLVDSLSLNLSRRAAIDRLWMRPLLAFEARRLAADERRMIAASASSWLVSERDRRHLAASLPASLADRLQVVPLALPSTPESALLPTQRTSRPAGEAELVITGNLGYFPTVRGIDWFLDQVWPEVARKHPRARLLVAGARPPRALARRVRRLGGRVLADPVDLAQLLAGADIALAPLLAGSGTPIKLLEALAAGIPAVATPAAADGLDPALARCLEIPEDAAAWVTALSGLVANPVAARARAAVVARLVRELHGAERLSERLEELLGQAPPTG